MMLHRYGVRRLGTGTRYESAVGRALVAMTTIWLTFGCAGQRPIEVSPSEIPALEEHIAEHPNDGIALLRYAAALYAGDRCDSATVVARLGMVHEPADALGPLVLGRCLQSEGDFEQALDVYGTYLAEHADSRGAAVIRAQETIARRELATDRARTFLEREAFLTDVTPSARIVAVLPVEVFGDTTYQSLSRGLANILTTDLALLERFRMVERIQVSALLAEMQLSQSRRVDQTTAVRMGRMLRAGRMIQGVATIPLSGPTVLEASVMQSDGEVTAPAQQSGQLEDLMRMEKQLVVDIARQLGHELSDAELQLILENGTQNLTAFLAYSRGLEAEDLGDFPAAALHFGDAVRADPEFRMARDAFQAATVAPQVAAATPAAVTTLPSAPEPPAAEAPTVGDATTTAIIDVSATQGEAATLAADLGGQTQQASTSTSADPHATVSNLIRLIPVTVRIRIP